MIDLGNINKYKHIHMRGIGGISMSGIAEILNNWGILVTGSDDARSENTDKLCEAGLKVTIGPDLEELSKADLLVYTAAMPKDDIELVTSQNLGIPIVERADFLGEITKIYQNTIGVSRHAWKNNYYFYAVSLFFGGWFRSYHTSRRLFKTD